MMPTTGKHRTAKRPSGGSYASTITTVVFVGIFILGVWMLTSNSYVSSNKSTTRLSENVSKIRPRKIPIDSPAFEDNPGDLPEDAIRGDDGSADETKSRVEDIVNGEDAKKQEKTEMGVNKRKDKNKVEEKQNNEDSRRKNEHSEKKNDTEEEEEQEKKTKNDKKTNERGRTEEDEQEKKTKNDKKTNEHDITEEDEQEKKTKNDKKTNEHDITEEDEQEKKTKNDKKTNERGRTEEDEQEKKTKNDKKTNEHDITEEDEQEKKTKNDKKTNEHDITDEDEQEKKMKNDKKTNEHDITEEDEQEKKTKNDKKTNEHDITEDEQEKRMEKHQEQQEQSQNEETGNETKPQTEEDKIETAAIPEKDLSGEAGGTMAVSGNSSGIPNESNESKKGWKTQAGQSDNEKERQIGKSDVADVADDYKWELCNVTSGTDYVPCLDNEKAIKKLRSRGHFEHRERHCPEEGPMCLVPVPEGYMTPIRWPHSRDKIWFHNVPHKSLAKVKGHQNWVKVSGEFLAFPGGGTQFIHGALHYIDLLQQAVPEIEWGKQTRVVLDVGCGVASFGGYLFEKNVLTMSFAPNDEHESQIQFALERGIPAISAVMGTRRLPFPSNVYDLIHCARCRVPWHKQGGMLLLEINRLLRPGGYFVWSATPVYRKDGEDVKIWTEMSALTVAMCWELVTIKKDKLDAVDVAIYRKPESNECYNGRKKQEPPMCKPDDDPNAAWYVPLQACMHNNPIGDIERGSRWPEEWPERVQTPPYWLNKSQMGIYGKPSPDDFKADYEHWKRVVNNTYTRDLKFNWTNVRNVMDMRAVYGGFAAALKDMKLWVLNVVSTSSPDTLPIIFERGLFGIYHDWCESFSTYPRTYDLLHADHLFSMLKKRCKIAPVMVEVDRIVRPGGKLIVRDEPSTIEEVEKLLKSLHWDIQLSISRDQERILSAQKSTWRPDTYVTVS